jgi:hypothetical protein
VRQQQAQNKGQDKAEEWFWSHGSFPFRLGSGAAPVVGIITGNYSQEITILHHHFWLKSG